MCFLHSPCTSLVLLASAQWVFIEWMGGMNQENPDSGSGLKAWIEQIYTVELLQPWKNADCKHDHEMKKINLRKKF